VTCSIHSTTFPSRASWIAMCVIAVVGVAPCQCFSLGENQTTSPARISSIGPPSRCAQPTPDVTINVWPNGCVCHAVRAPGSNVTLAPRTRLGLPAAPEFSEGGGTSNNGSIRTVPVKYSAGPLFDACDPDRLITMLRHSLQRLNTSTTQLSFDVKCLDVTPINHQLFLSLSSAAASISVKRGSSRILSRSGSTLA